MRTTSRLRTGLTLVEVLVALILFATAALTTAAVHGTTTRLAAEAHLRQQLATRAMNVMDSLRSIPCGAVAPGTSTPAAGTLRWVVAATTRTRIIRLTAVPAFGTPWNAETVIPC
jgi:prepilin-type N-terminal cleavage/methylation domain-containing protein